MTLDDIDAVVTERMAAKGLVPLGERVFESKAYARAFRGEPPVISNGLIAQVTVCVLELELSDPDADGLLAQRVENAAWDYKYLVSEANA